MLIVIIWNTYLLTIPDSGSSDSVSGEQWFFILFYTLEMLIKIFALGFIFGPGAYLRDYVNFMDILIVVTSWLPILFNSSTINLNFQMFNSLRVLRPLRTIKNVKSLRRILMAIIQALPLLKDTMII